MHQKIFKSPVRAASYKLLVLVIHCCGFNYAANCLFLYTFNSLHQQPLQMKILYNTRYLFILLIGALAFACTSKPAPPSLVGTWVLTRPDSITSSDGLQMQITFDKDSTALSEIVKAGTVTDKDSIVYHVIDNGTYLITKEKSGREEKIKIIELTDKTMKIVNESETPPRTVELTKK
jgi:hypothetical protein